MKKALLLLTLITSISAFGATYKNGTYRGLYISRQETEVEIQFDVKEDVMSDLKFRVLNHKGKDYLKDPEVIELQKGYFATLEYLDGKVINDETLDKLLYPEEIERAGATVRTGKVKSAIQYGLNVGPVRPLKK